MGHSGPASRTKPRAPLCLTAVGTPPTRLGAVALTWTPATPGPRGRPRTHGAASRGQGRVQTEPGRTAGVTLLLPNPAGSQVRRAFSKLECPQLRPRLGGSAPCASARRGKGGEGRGGARGARAPRDGAGRRGAEGPAGVREGGGRPRPGSGERTCGGGEDRGPRCQGPPLPRRVLRASRARAEAPAAWPGPPRACCAACGCAS